MLLRRALVDRLRQSFADEDHGMAREYRYVHPNEAAEHFGVSVDCVYERIRSGEITAIRDGARWVVRLDAEPDQPIANGAADSLDGDRRIVVRLAAPSHDPSLDLLAAQLATHTQAIERLQAQLNDLCAAVAAPPARLDRRPADVSGERTPSIEQPAATQTHRRSPGRKVRIAVFACITVIFLGSIVIQTSASQRSNDLTVAFIFVCGAVIGAVATWLALGRVPAAAMQPAAESDLLRQAPYVVHRPAPFESEARDEIDWLDDWRKPSAPRTPDETREGVARRRASIEAGR